MPRKRITFNLYYEIPSCWLNFKGYLLTRSEASELSLNKMKKIINGIEITIYEKKDRTEGIGNLLTRFANKPQKKTCTYEWQDKAFTIADKLGINFKENKKDLPNWLRLFKTAFTAGKQVKLDQCYAFLIDYPKELNQESKLKLFYWKYYHA